MGQLDESLMFSHQVSAFLLCLMSSFLETLCKHLLQRDIANHFSWRPTLSGTKNHGKYYVEITLWEISSGEYYLGQEFTGIEINYG